MPLKSSSAWWSKIRKRLNVPTADDTVNSFLTQAVGNKTDAAVTTVGTTKSLMAYVKGALNQLATIATAILNISVQETSATIAGTIVQDGATGTPNIVTVASNASANTFGNWTALDAAAAADVWISHVTVMPQTGSKNCCLEIGTGASPATKIRFSFCEGELSGVGHIPIVVFTLPIPIKVASGTAISARASASTPGPVSFFIGLSYYAGLE